MAESFLTTYRETFIYPYYVPLLLKASQPPQVTKEKGVFEVQNRSVYCDCNMHSFDPVKNRVRELIEKEEHLMKKFEEIREERKVLDIEMLEHSCGIEDEKMKSIYETSFTKKAFPIVPYRSIKPDSDDYVPIPVPVIRVGLNNGYRDPTTFRTSCIVRPTIHPPRPLDMTAEQPLQHYWTFGRTEYQDTISRSGHVNLLAQQSFKEPLPSSRRRVGDPCI